MGPLATRRAVLRAGAFAAGVGLLASGLVGCDGGDEEVPSEPVSVDPSEGKLGGKLVLYTSCSESLVNAVVSAFMEELGVAVSVVRGKTGELLARVVEDGVAGRGVADVVWGGDASWYAGLAEAGVLEEHVSTENDAMRAGCGSVDGLCTPVTREVVVIAVGPDADGSEVPAEGDEGSEGEGGPEGDGASEGDDVSEVPSEVPPAGVTGYASLVEVGVAGGVALEGPEESDAGLALAACIDVLLSSVEEEADAKTEADGADEATGEGAESDEGATSENAPAADLVTVDPNAPWEYLRDLLSMSVVASGEEVGDGEAALEAALLGGAGAALAFEQECAAAVREGYELEVVHPEEGLVATLGCTAIVDGCENLEQARAWVDFVTGQACQQLIASEALGRPVREDVGDPEGLPEVGEVVGVDRERLVATWAAVADGTWEPTE